jgi:acetyl esterase/lipase
MANSRVSGTVAVAVAVSCACALHATAAPAADVRCAPARQPPRRAVVLLHAGGFWIDAPARTLRAMCGPWTAAGFETVAVDYPARDFAGALRASRRAAERLRSRARHVVAYGESAGGTLADLLALEGRVDAAATVAAPTDLLAWNRGNGFYWHDTMHMTVAQRRHGSPALRRVRRRPPILLLHSPGDEVVPLDQSVALARRLPTATLVRLRGRHLQDRSATRRAIRWLVAFSG